MKLIDWIDRKLTNVQDTLEYGKYFDTLLPEKGTDVYYLLNPNAGIDLILTLIFRLRRSTFIPECSKAS